MLGGQSEEYGAYLPPRHFQIAVGLRGGISRFHWEGYRRRRDILSGVRNYQTIVDVTGTYQLNRQAFLSVSLPWAFSERRFLFGDVPTVRFRGQTIPISRRTNNRPRWFTPANGIGDMTVILQSWLLPIDKFRTGNLAVGFGLQMPTGNFDDEALFPDGVIAPVDISIQPGAGGLGLIATVQGFKQYRKLTFFGTGTYLCQPRNATPTLLNSVVRNPQQALRNYLNNTGLGPAITNSVPDAYVGQVGVAFPLTPSVKIRKQPAVVYGTLGARIEGTPPRDLIGGFQGFRRPGLQLFAQPGLGAAWGRHNVLVTVPISTLINVQNAPATPRREDATMPWAIVLAQYTYTY